MLKYDYKCTLITTRATPIQEIGIVGFNVHFIPDDLNVLDEPEWISQLAGSNCLFFIDGYKFCNEYFRKMKVFEYRIVYIDDNSGPIKYVDAIVNHNPAVRKEDYVVDNKIQLYLGAKFVMLRSKFLEKAQIEIKDYQIRNTVFICFGGSDEQDLCYQISVKLSKLDCIERLHVVLGAANNKSKMYNLDGNPKVNIYKNLSEGELIKVMEDSDLAIVPASTILFEICAIKMPVITTVIADNQEKIFDFFTSRKLAYGIHDSGQISSILTCNLIADVYRDAPQYIKMQREVIDGRSKERFIHIIKCLNYGN